MNLIIQKICEGVLYNVSYDEYIIVTMTSWKKRISNVSSVLNRILIGNALPDKININLAISEFPNKEQDFPDELTKLINDNKIIEINWLNNNTTVWKKIIPTMYKYPNSWTICIDDDFIYPKDFVETFIKKHIEIPGKPISGVSFPLHDRHNQHCGCGSMDTLKLLEPYILLINNEIYNNGSTDTFYTYCYAMNNIDMVYAGKTFHENMLSFNSINGYSLSKNIDTYKLWRDCKKYIK